jgi:hypothetical protein
VVGKTSRRALALVLAFTVVTSHGRAFALGGLRHPSVEELVTGTRGILAPTLAPLSRPRASVLLRADSTAARPGPAMVRVSEELLYGISGLRTSGVMAGASVAGLFVAGEAAQLSSPLGNETRLAATAALCAPGWAVSVGGVYDGVFLMGMAGADLVSISVSSLVWVNGYVRVGGSVDRLRIAGEEYPGADVSLVLASELAAGVSLFGTVEFDRRGGAVPGAAATVAGLGPARFGLGYEIGPDVLKGSLAVRWRAFDFAAGVCYHPVLGEKREITLTWFG